MKSKAVKAMKKLTKKEDKAKQTELEKSRAAFLARIPKNDEEFLERLIEASERAITKQGTSIDELFQNQADRLKKQLEELRSKK